MSLPKFCIDPGHGGYDSGAVNGSAREKDIVLHIGLQLRDILSRVGFPVVMTRESDVSPSGDSDKDHELAARVRISNEAAADVFLSIHVNAGGGKGSEIYVYKDGTAVRPLAEKIVANVSQIVGGYHGQAVKDGSWIYVVKNTKAPAMLVEIGFIDTSDLDAILANIDKFATEIAKAICDQYGVAIPEPAPKVNTPAIGKCTVIVNGTKLDVDGLLVDGHSYVPVRALSEALGAEVAWDGDTNTVTVTKKGCEGKC